MIAYTTDDVFSSIPEINVIDINSGEQLAGEDRVLALKSIIDDTPTKTISSLWGAFDESVITGHENGTLTKWDLRGGSTPTMKVRPHTAQINDMQFNQKQNMFITASKDNVAKVDFCCCILYHCFSNVYQTFCSFLIWKHLKN